MRLLLIDDDELVRLSLKTILESDPSIKVVATGKNGQEAIALFKEHLPDILLMDIRMDTMDGITAGIEIIAVHPNAKILYLTTFSDDEYIIKALRMGAKGYILKQNYESLIPTLNSVALGQNVYGDEIMNKLPTLLIQNANSLENYNLTDREIDVIHHVSEGLSNKEIAEKLFLSEGTVRNYISTILEKLNLRDRTQLAIFFYKHLTSSSK